MLDNYKCLGCGHTFDRPIVVDDGLSDGICYECPKCGARKVTEYKYAKINVDNFVRSLTEILKRNPEFRDAVIKEITGC